MSKPAATARRTALRKAASTVWKSPGWKARGAIQPSPRLVSVGAMVDQAVAPRYWRLIKEFEKLTGVPILLNTSFNENEPIVMSPKQALETFAKTRMDLLVLGNLVVRRSGAGAPAAARQPVSAAELGFRP